MGSDTPVVSRLRYLSHLDSYKLSELEYIYLHIHMMYQKVFL